MSMYPKLRNQKMYPYLTPSSFRQISASILDTWHKVWLYLGLFWSAGLMFWLAVVVALYCKQSFYVQSGPRSHTHSLFSHWCGFDLKKKKTTTCADSPNRVCTLPQWLQPEERLPPVLLLLLLLLDEKYGLIESKESHNRQSQQPSAAAALLTRLHTQAGLQAANQGDDPRAGG